MAIAVDRFELLLHLIEENINEKIIFSSKVLICFGTFYVVKKSVSILSNLFEISKLFFLSKYRPVNFVEKFGKWAVITGCTDGIGYEISKELAFYGMNILLIGRNKEKLERVKQEIEENFSVETKIIIIDFAKDHNYIEAIKLQITDIDIGLLVNNVGVMYEYPDYFLNLTEEKLQELINVNITAATMMTHLVLPKLILKNKGVIVSVSSSAGTYPFPLITVYSATKAYLNYLMSGISFEYRKSNVGFLTLKPYFINTKMTWFKSNFLRRANIFQPTASTYAKHSIACIGRFGETTGYWPHSLQNLFMEQLSYRIIIWISYLFILNTR